MGCGPPGEIVKAKELKIEFENKWWYALDDPFAKDDQIFCYYFNTAADVKPPDDGVIHQIEEGYSYSYILSNFQRLKDAYYLSEYDTTLKVFADDDGNYSVKATQGLFSHTSKIIPCSLQ